MLNEPGIVTFEGDSQCVDVCLFDSLHPRNNLSVIKGRVFLG